MNGSVSAVVPSWDGKKVKGRFCVSSHPCEVAYRHHPAYNDAADLVDGDAHVFELLLVVRQQLKGSFALRESLVRVDQDCVELFARPARLLLGRRGWTLRTGAAILI